MAIPIVTILNCPERRVDCVAHEMSGQNDTAVVRREE